MRFHGTTSKKSRGVQFVLNCGLEKNMRPFDF